MNAARAASAAAAFAVCAVYGRVKASREEEKLRWEKAMLSDLHSAERLIVSSRVPLWETAGKLSREGACAEMWNDICLRLVSGDSFSKAYSAARKPPVCPEAADIVGELAEKLGTEDIGAEAERLRCAVDKLLRLCSERESSAAKKCRLIRTLSVLLGLAAAIVLL